MAPLPCARIWRSSCFMQAQTPRRLIAVTRSKASPGSSAASASGSMMPALLNAMSSRPNSATVRSTRAATCACRRRRGDAKPSARWPAAVSSSVAAETRMIASVGSMIRGASRSSTRTSPGPYMSAPRITPPRARRRGRCRSTARGARRPARGAVAPSARRPRRRPRPRPSAGVARRNRRAGRALGRAWTGSPSCRPFICCQNGSVAAVAPA